MWKSLEEKIVQVNKVTGLEIIFLPGEKLLINGVTISNKKHKIVRDSDVTGITGIEELTGKINTQVPLSLVFNGKGILVKKLPPAPIIDEPVTTMLPNANPADFFYELHQYNDFTVAAITRKEVIEKLVTSLKTAGFKILQVSFGFNSITNLLPFLTADSREQVSTNTFTLLTDTQKNITGFEAKETVTTDTFPSPEYAIGDQYVRSPQLLAFAAAVHLMTGSLKNPPAIASDIIIHEREEFRYFKLFRFAGLSILGCIFFILLLNFILYSHYFSKNKELQVTQRLSKDQLQKKQFLHEQIKRKESFLHHSGWLKQGKASLYADRIASLTPSNTLLTSMVICPLKSNSSGEFPAMNFKTDTIQVTGICDNPVEINQFVNNLKIIPEFSIVSLKNYTYKKEQETALFSIEIITK